MPTKIDRDKLKVKIISGNEDGVFYVDSSLKHLYVMKNIDYEKKKQHNLVFRVEDGGNPLRYSDCYLYIKVLDQNDNSPIIKKMKPVFISELTVVGRIIATVISEDVDTVNTQMTYGLVQRKHVCFRD